jgi:predicted DNA binding protein
MQRRPIIFEAGVVHDCWMCDTTERLKDGSVLFRGGATRGNKVFANVELRSPFISKFVDAFASHPIVTRVSPLVMGPDSAELLVTCKYDGTVYENLIRSGCILMEPTITEDGADRVSLLAPSEKHMRDFFSRMGESGTVTLKAKRYLDEKDQVSFNLFKTSGFTKFKTAAALLSPRQRECFEIACRNGYYARPHRITLDGLRKKQE